MLIDSVSTAQDVCQFMATKLNFADPMDDALCFSLHECIDGVTVSRALAGEREILPIMESWEDSPDAKLVFQCNVFTESILKSSDPAVVRLLFIQAVYSINTGVYPCNHADAVLLAALQIQAKFGAHNPATHKPGFLDNVFVEYIPAPLREKDPATPREWQEEIFKRHAVSMTENPMSAYLNLVSRRDYFGTTLFAVKQRSTKSLPKRLFLAIGRRGILLLKIPKDFTNSDGMETLAEFPLADIYRWSFKPGEEFSFELKLDDSPDMPVHKFETAEGEAMSNLLTEYALGLLREMGLNADGTKRIKPEPASSAAAAIAEPEPAASFSAAPDAYAAVAGDAGALAQAATRSYAAEEAGAAAAEEAAPAAEEAAPEEGEQLPANWTKEWDGGSEAYYYYNHATGESRWEPPEA